MIKFFRKIRKNILAENKFVQYLIYAFGEIFLVMIGILLALQVNNWNETRKDRLKEIKIYENILGSLSADSADIVKIIGYITSGMQTQKFFISNNPEVLIENFTIQQLKDSLEISQRIGSSFFPRFSVFNNLTSNSFETLLQSELIKRELLDLYDRKYKRYLQIDASIDVKAEINLREIISGDLQIFREHNKIDPANAFDAEKFITFYPLLIREFGSILITADNALDSLTECQKLVIELLSLIHAELERLKK